MDRYDARDRVDVEELISTAERGVEVALTRNGKVVARVVPTLPPASKPELAAKEVDGDWLTALRELHASLPSDFPRTGWLETLREARDEDSF